MAIGDMNKKFGWIWLLIGPLMGMYIGSQINSLGTAYTAVMQELAIAGQNVPLYMGETLIRTANRLFHAHSALLAFLNIIYGLSIDEVRLSDKTRKLGSVLLIAGTILVTMGFYFIQVESLYSIGFPLRIVGGIGVVMAIVIVIAGQLKKTGP